MIIKAKNKIYRKQNPSEGVLYNAEIRDISVYYNRFNDTLNFILGVFQNIENELILVDKLFVVIEDSNQRDGIILLPDPENTGETATDLKQYFVDNGTLEGVNVVDYGMPTVDVAKSFFTGGDSLNNPEVEPKNELAKKWLLNTVKYDNKLLVENFEFIN